MKPLPPFKAIAAIDAKRGLGKGGDLPWHIPEDLKYFASVTKNTKEPALRNGVIMGRVTCESIPDKYWPLSNRHNVVITRNQEWFISGADIYYDLESALRALDGKVETIFVVGGGQIYTLALQMEACKELLLTRINKDFLCDAFFPSFEEHYTLQSTIGQGEHKGLGYVFEQWKRN